MPLSAGARLGPYEILSPLGAGGMGEVYRARDTRLSRDVAIKILPAELAADGDALARFEREATAGAALLHPNILSIFDFETQVGQSSSFPGSSFALIRHSCAVLLFGRHPSCTSFGNRRKSMRLLATPW